MMVTSHHCVVLSWCSGEIFAWMVVLLHMSAITFLICWSITFNSWNLAFTRSPLMTCDTIFWVECTNFVIFSRWTMTSSKYIGTITFPCLWMVSCIVLFNSNYLIISVVMLHLIWFLMNHLLILVLHILMKLLRVLMLMVHIWMSISSIIWVLAAYILAMIILPSRLVVDMPIAAYMALLTRRTVLV